jgi:ABC-type multidrug transport system permease subunit
MKNRKICDRNRRMMVMLLAVLLAMVLPMSVSADVVSGLKEAKSTLTNDFTTILTDVVVPIAAIVIGLFCLVCLVMLAVTHNRGGNMQGWGVALGIALAAEILVVSFPTWGPMLWGTAAT